MRIRRTLMRRPNSNSQKWNFILTRVCADKTDSVSESRGLEKAHDGTLGIIRLITARDVPSWVTCQQCNEYKTHSLVFKH